LEHFSNELVKFLNFYKSIKMKIITVAHQKGGVGKTTLALNLAACFKDDLRVGLLDTDVQGSLSGLVDMLEGIELIPFNNDLASLRTVEKDILIIDTPPYLTNQLPALFEASDFVLVPSKVGFLDVMAVRATIQMLKEVQTRKKELKAAIVLNMVKPRTNMNDEIREILKDYDIPVLKTAISDRVSYSRSPIMSGVFAGDDDKAKAEITALADEIFSFLEL
jgi:chromosome partitioning protein